MRENNAVAAGLSASTRKTARGKPAWLSRRWWA